MNVTLTFGDYGFYGIPPFHRWEGHKILKGAFVAHKKLEMQKFILSFLLELIYVFKLFVWRNHMYQNEFKEITNKIM